MEFAHQLGITLYLFGEDYGGACILLSYVVVGLDWWPHIEFLIQFTASVVLAEGNSWSILALMIYGFVGGWAGSFNLIFELFFQIFVESLSFWRNHFGSTDILINCRVVFLPHSDHLITDCMSNLLEFNAQKGVQFLISQRRNFE
jgi:hypothetical protein